MRWRHKTQITVWPAITDLMTAIVVITILGGVTAIPTKFKTSHHSALWGLLLIVSFVNYFAEFSSEEHILDVITTHLIK